MISYCSEIINLLKEKINLDIQHYNGLNSWEVFNVIQENFKRFEKIAEKNDSIVESKIAILELQVEKLKVQNELNEYRHTLDYLKKL
jgi:hypothetical protein